jgi:hypothetical protein
MKIQEVIDRATTDPLFAAELAGKVGAAARSGTSRESIHGDAWNAALAVFAEDPDELARMVGASDEVGSPWWTTTITTTTLTTTTVFCTTTTTTSVTTITTAGEAVVKPE